MLCLAALLAAVAAQTALAEGLTQDVVKKGALLTDANDQFVARLDRVDWAADGSLKDVSIVTEQRIVHIPVNTLSASGPVVKTSLAKADIRKMAQK
jgi:hypothetical protein